MGCKPSKSKTFNNAPVIPTEPAHGVAPRNTTSNYPDQMIYDVIWYIDTFTQTGDYGSTSTFHRDNSGSRKLKITNQLLLAVAYGMESKAVNVPVKLKDTAGLFKSHLYAEDLLKKSPEFLLSRGNVTDWAGRTFKNITAFEYALWARDFKMIQMMLGCIPATPEGDVIWAALFEQTKQVKRAIESGGGLTYTHTYDWPNLDTAGIPDGTTITVTETHTENNFNTMPLRVAYQDYITHFYHNVDGSARTWLQRDAYWTKFIGKLQRLLPVHVLQRYCDLHTPFYPRPQFNGEFKRSTDFYHWITSSRTALFGSTLSSDFALLRAHRDTVEGLPCGRTPYRCGVGYGEPEDDLRAICDLVSDSKSEMGKIIQQLSLPRLSTMPQLR